MALEVAVRNPERYYDFLKTFSKFDGLLLDDAGILKIYVQLYLDGVVSAINLDIEASDSEDIKNYILNNNTHNNEWGFPTGFQAAFTRYLKTLSEFGFIYAQYNEPLKLSKIACAVVDGKITLSEAFAVQSMRFYRKSPYRRVLNDFNYFDFILKVIKKLGQENKKLSYPQFMLSLFSLKGDVDEFIKVIRENKIGNDFDKAYQLAQKMYDGDENFGLVCKMQSAFNDYGNTVFRVLQLTGFITVETQGCLMLSFNSNRSELYDALSHCDFSLSEEEKESPLLYFEKLGSFDINLQKYVFDSRDIQKRSVDGYNEKLKKIISDYGLDKARIAEMLSKVSRGDKKDKNDFWYIQEPLKFEFFLSLYLYACLGDDYDYKPNYKCDTAGIPYSHAPGNIGDIEIFNENRYWLIEATLIRNKVQQVNSETINLFRHINDNYSGAKYMSLVAPVIHDDTRLLLKVATVITMSEKKSLLYSKPYSTEDFINQMECGDCIEDMHDSTINFASTLGKFLNNVCV